MMKSAQKRHSRDPACVLNSATQRRIFAQGKVRPHAVVIAGVGRQDPTQVPLPEHQDMVQALPPDRADQPLDMAVLPRRAPRNGPITDTHHA